MSNLTDRLFNLNCRKRICISKVSMEQSQLFKKILNCNFPIALQPNPHGISHTLDICRDKSLDLHRIPYNVPACYPQPVRTPLKGVRPSRRAHMQCPNKVRGTCGYRGGVHHPVEWQSHSYHWGLPRPKDTALPRNILTLMEIYKIAD